jgi:hypothetical protein
LLFETCRRGCATPAASSHLTLKCACSKDSQVADWKAGRKTECSARKSGAEKKLPQMALGGSAGHGGGALAVHLRSLMQFEDKGGFATFEGEWVAKTSLVVGLVLQCEEHTCFQ